ncbi:type I-B CRISPR-associated protein Cas5b [Hydrogenobacter thermophilus]|uniref:type I-B CRISPR-associated protein Cas5b n=1 Tax=Hydrogenobacter thermophilus TaxID=940 RepID=UPI0030FB814B
MNDSLKVLKIKIYQPQAHYRMPFTYQRRHTYPIPPYSTVIGLLCNLLGIRNNTGDGEPNDDNYLKLKNIKISIAGTFESKTTEYIWFRNLSKENHVSRFGSYANRYVGGHIEHIGGQMPAPTDILNDVRLWIYLYHEEENFLEKIKNSFENPNDRISVLHLGRAEDWIVIEDLKFVELKYRETGGDFKKFFWIPEDLYLPYTENKWNEQYQKIEGIAYRITTFYELQDGIRNFDYVEVKLNSGEVSFCESNSGVLLDEEENSPVFLASLKGV